MRTNKKAGAGRAGSGKKIGEGAGRRACKHCFKNLIPPTLQECQMSKCRHLQCRVTHECITTSQHVLIFLQTFYMASLSTKISSNLEAYPSNTVDFARKKCDLSRKESFSAGFRLLTSFETGNRWLTVVKSILCWPMLWTPSGTSLCETKSFLGC